MSQTDSAPRVLVVNGSSSQKSSIRKVSHLLAGKLRDAGAVVDLLDLAEEPLPLFNPDSAYGREDYPALKARVDQADVLVLATPDYHGCMSSALKNFLDHFWQEYTGRLFVPVVASYDKGLTVADQIRTVARQCYAWALPYAVTYADKADFKDGQIASEAFGQRLEMVTRDICTYGAILARQRQADLSGTGPGFLARLRPAAR